MRKKRVIISIANPVIRNMLRYFFTVQGGYEFLTNQDQVGCPVRLEGQDCPHPEPCADVIIADLRMPGTNGTDLFSAQARKGCKIPVRNKAIIYDTADNGAMNDILNLGCAYFETPIDFRRIESWINACVANIDLSKPLRAQRREKRVRSYKEILCLVPPANSFLRGTAVNMSMSGICLKTSAPLACDQSLLVYPDHLAHPSRNASVRWSVKVNDELFMNGLQFC